mmetsp:Transcript_42097/g.120885  ORF Transcript_42097/g.120885 Transcript_42097/m.120885 type:complete len:245 (+) Transcript_42097:991-1725(+)
MRVGQRGSHEEAELVVVRYVLVPQLDHKRGSVAYLLLLEHWLQRGVQRLANVLQQHPLPELNAQLHCLQQARVRKLARAHAAVAGDLPVRLDVLVRLPLRIDHQRPPPGVGNDDAVLHRQVVVRQAADGPLLDDDWLAQHVDQVGALLVGYAALVLRGQPQIHEVYPVLSRERPSVAHHASGHQGVPRQQLVLLTESLHGLRPAVLFTAEALDELVGVAQLDDAHVHVLLQLVLLLHGAVVVRL